MLASNAFRIPAERRELAAPALPDGLGELGLRMIGKVQERRRGAPLFAHEQHGDVRGEQRERRGDAELSGVRALGQAIADGAIAHLIVVLAKHMKVPSGKSNGRTPVAVLPVARVLAAVGEPVPERLSEMGDAPEVGVIGVAFARQHAAQGVVEVVAPLTRETEPT